VTINKSGASKFREYSLRLYPKKSGALTINEQLRFWRHAQIINVTFPHKNITRCMKLESESASRPGTPSGMKDAGS
jgi:hypothetical protein